MHFKHSYCTHIRLTSRWHHDHVALTSHSIEKSAQMGKSRSWPAIIALWSHCLFFNLKFLSATWMQYERNFSQLNSPRAPYERPKSAKWVLQNVAQMGNNKCTHGTPKVRCYPIWVPFSPYERKVNAVWARVSALNTFTICRGVWLGRERDVSVERAQHEHNQIAFERKMSTKKCPV